MCHIKCSSLLQQNEYFSGITVDSLLPNKFNSLNVTEDFVLKLLKDINIEKAVGIDNPSGKFIERGRKYPSKTNLQYMQSFHTIFCFPNRLPGYQIETIIQKGFHSTS